MEKFCYIMREELDDDDDEEDELDSSSRTTRWTGAFRRNEEDDDASSVGIKTDRIKNKYLFIQNWNARRDRVWKLEKGGKPVSFMWILFGAGFRAEHLSLRRRFRFSLRGNGCLQLCNFPIVEQKVFVLSMNHIILHELSHLVTNFGLRRQTQQSFA